MASLPNIAAEYLQGVHIGASIAQERQRLKAEHARAQMEAQARAETNQRAYLMEQARMQTQQAYQQAQLGLRARALDQAQQVNQQRTQDAAARMADQHGFDQAVAGGAPVMEAMAKFPRASASAAVQLQRDTREQQHQKALETESQGRLDLAKQEFMERQRQAALKPPPRTPGGLTANETMTRLDKLNTALKDADDGDKPGLQQQRDTLAAFGQQQWPDLFKQAEPAPIMGEGSSEPLPTNPITGMPQFGEQTGPAPITLPPPAEAPGGKTGPTHRYNPKTKKLEPITEDANPS